jgi:hypothetical protein
VPNLNFFFYSDGLRDKFSNDYQLEQNNKLSQKLSTRKINETQDERENNKTLFYFLRYKKILRFKTCGTLLILIRNTIFASSCDSCFLHLFGLISKSIKMCNQMGISRYEFLMPDKTLHNVSFIECNNESICIFPLIFRS